MISFEKNQNRDNMILDIYGKVQNKKLVFELPFYQFDFSEKIALKRLVIEWKSHKEKVYGIVKTNLLDLSSTNYKQQLAGFTKLPMTAVTDIDIVNPVYHDIMKLRLDEATFNIEPMFEKRIPAINNVYLQIITTCE